MRRNYWIYTGIALLAVAGCHKHATPVASTPKFEPSPTVGMAAQDMAKTASQFGIQVYPGAEPDTAHYSAVATASDSPRAYLAYVSLDPLDKIVSYYKALGFSESVLSGTTQLTGISTTGAALTINVGKDLTAKTRFTITAIMQPTAPATQVAANTPVAPGTSPTRTYVTPPVTASRDSTEGGWSFSTSNGAAPEGAAASQPQPEQQPVETQPTDNSGQSDPPQDQQGTDETGNELPQHDGPPGDPPL